MNSVENTIFISLKKYFKNIFSVLSKNYEDVSILVEKSSGKIFRHSKSGSIIKDNTFASYGAVIRLTHKGNLYEYSFNDFSSDFINNLSNKIKEFISQSSNFNFKSIPKKNTFKVNSGDYLSFNKSSEFIIDPANIPDDEILNLLTDIQRKALNYNKNIIDCVCIFQYLVTHKLFLSSCKDLEQHLLWSNGVVQPMAKMDNKTRYYLQTYSVLGGAELLSKMKEDVIDSCNTVLELLNSVPPTPGIYDVICMPDVTGLIAHEAFGHGVEMDMFVKDRALAKKFIGEYIASPIVSMHDNAATCLECGSYFFDDEGTPSSDTVIIENGILKSGINDYLSANRLNVSPTGNGRRESFERKVYTRMTNTYFQSGNDSLEQMILSIKDGILLENAASGMEDPKNWGIQCMVNVGREIHNGQLTGKLYSPICLSGYVPDLLKSISMISNSIEINGCGYCGKGYKEWVKVSDGGPALKARVKIS